MVDLAFDSEWLNVISLASDFIQGKFLQFSPARPRLILCIRDQTLREYALLQSMGSQPTGATNLKSMVEAYIYEDVCNQHTIKNLSVRIITPEEYERRQKWYNDTMYHRRRNEQLYVVCTVVTGLVFAGIITSMVVNN